MTSDSKGWMPGYGGKGCRGCVLTGVTVGSARARVSGGRVWWYTGLLTRDGQRAVQVMRTGWRVVLKGGEQEAVSVLYEQNRWGGD